MPTDDEIAVSTALVNAASGPLRVASDAGSVEQHSLDELITADRYVSGKAAASQGRRGIRITRLVPDGTVQRCR